MNNTDKLRQKIEEIEGAIHCQESTCVNTPPFADNIKQYVSELKSLLLDEEIKELSLEVDTSFCLMSNPVKYRCPNRNNITSCSGAFFINKDRCPICNVKLNWPKQTPEGE